MVQMEAGSWLIGAVTPQALGALTAEVTSASRHPLGHSGHLR